MKSFDIFLEMIPPKDLHVNRFANRRLNYAMHYHPQLELMYCSEGALNLHLDKYTIPMRAGGFAVIAPLAVHSFSCNQTCSCTFLHIPESVYLQLGIPDVLSAPYTGHLLDLTLSETARELEHLMTTVYNYMTDGDNQIATYYTMILLTLCIRHIQDTRQDICTFKSKNHPLLRDVLSYIQQHYKEPVTLGSLCAEFSIGKSAMSAMLNTELQSSLPELLNKYRMIEAERLLLHTQMPITEISGEIGYGSPCNFNRNFQKHFGLSPREYRNQL